MNAYSILTELTEFSMKYDPFNTCDDEDHVEDVFRVLLDKDRVLMEVVNNELVGYLESWRLDYEQLGRVLLDIPFNIESEDIETGPVCYLANITIHPEYRNGCVMDNLAKNFKEQNRDASYWIGHAQRKSVGLIKHYDLSKIRI